MKREEINKYLGYKNMNIIDAMKKIDENAKGLLFIVDEQKRLLGTVTDGDIRRWIIKTGNLSGNISLIMNDNPKFLYKKEISFAQDRLKQYQISAMPVLNNVNKISDIIFAEYTVSDETQEIRDELKDIPIVIMAGGKGTRLYPYTKILPKPLIPIGDIPIMERIIDRFIDFGANNFFVTVNYKKNMIISYFAEQDVDYDIRYIEEEAPLGTAGSLTLLEPKPDIPLFVTNCDVLIQADYEDIYQHHKDSGNDITMVVSLKNITIPYGVINANENGIISSIEEKPKMSYFVNTGMYVMNPNIIDEIPENCMYHMTDLVDKLMTENKKVGIYPISEDSFLDMGEFEEMRRMEEQLEKKS